jgi:hypothetical protein
MEGGGCSHISRADQALPRRKPREEVPGSDRAPFSDLGESDTGRPGEDPELKPMESSSGSERDWWESWLV